MPDLITFYVPDGLKNLMPSEAAEEIGVFAGLLEELETDENESSDFRIELGSGLLKALESALETSSLASCKFDFGSLNGDRRVEALQERFLEYRIWEYPAIGLGIWNGMSQVSALFEEIQELSGDEEFADFVESLQAIGALLRAAMRHYPNSPAVVGILRSEDAYNSWADVRRLRINQLVKA